MNLAHSPAEMTALRASWADGPIGFVPTMGALHAGHRALVERARAECGRVVASVFVNPTQFDDPGDLARYPRTLEADLALLREAGADAVFLPTFADLYPDDYAYAVRETRFATELCGAARPGHFDGVLTVVLKLFQVVRPDRAYFGEKDWQQLELVRGMVRAFFLPLEIVPCATVREPDGLAMSSRNTRLTPAQRALAPRLHEVLRTAATPAEGRAALEALGFRVDYLEERRGRRFVAAFLGNVRLIDNVPV